MAILLDSGLVLFEPVFHAFPAAQAVDLLLGCSLGSDADPVVAVQAVVHTNAVAVEMEVKDAGPCRKTGRNLQPVASSLPGEIVQASLYSTKYLAVNDIFCIFTAGYF